MRRLMAPEHVDLDGDRARGCLCFFTSSSSARFPDWPARIDGVARREWRPLIQDLRPGTVYGISTDSRRWKDGRALNLDSGT
jgi:hypothetical protein